MPPTRHLNSEATGTRYLSTDAAAQKLGVGRMTIWRWCKNGKLPASNIADEGQRPRFRIAESVIENYMASLAASPA